MDAESPRRSPTRRSRNGCRECRRRHRRCDEVKPSCGYCACAGVQCVYSRELSWGGRPFKKSRFGQCLRNGVGVLNAVHDEATHTKSASDNNRQSYRARSSGGSPRSGSPFVYSTWPTSSDLSLGSYKTNESIAEGNWILTGHVSDSRACEGGYSQIQCLSGADISRTLASYPDLHDLSPTHRNLLAYFQHQTSRSLSCHDGIQSEICSSLLPMAMCSSHLLAAMLCAASCHRLSTGLDQDLSDIISLRNTAIEQLRDSLENNDEYSLFAALGTSLVLCLGNIVSSTNANDDWKVHLLGASALLQRLHTIGGLSNLTNTFLLRFYTSLKTISAGSGFKVSGTLFEVPRTLLHDDYIDDLAGFSTALCPLLERIPEIQESLQGKFAVLINDESGTYESRPDQSTYRCLELINQVQATIACRSSKFRPEISGSLSETTERDFILLDEAYHHMALLQLYNLVRWTGNFRELIQESVESIIHCISSMDILARPCPGVAVLPVLFQAGCSATLPGDKARIRELLSHSQTCFGMGNVLSSMQFLEGVWATAVNIGLPPYKSPNLGFLPY